MSGSNGARLAEVCRRLRPAGDLADPAQGTKTALRHLAVRYGALTDEIAETDDQLAVGVEQARPDLLAVFGVGVETAAQPLATCGDNPDRLHSDTSVRVPVRGVPGPGLQPKTKRHRLNRGGDRQANRALYTIVMVRMSHDADTRAYVERRTKEGLSKKEIIRCLKRYVARELYKILTKPNQTNQTNDLPSAA